ncbi:MAG: putative toxin [Mycobacteriaceae bacterium]
MELKNADSQLEKNKIRGRIGELRAGIDPNVPKLPIRIGDRTRIPDFVDRNAKLVREVKNTNSIGASQQLKDMAMWAKENHYTMELIVDTRTKLLAHYKK